MAKFDWQRPAYRVQVSTQRDRIRKMRRGPAIEEEIILFGKYSGFKLKSLPSSYLEWLISVTPDDKEAMKYAEVLADRPYYIERLNTKKE